jgi:GNAT superfamily N-acetyltransferase
MKRDDERHEHELLHGQLDALEEDIERVRRDLHRLATAHFEFFVGRSHGHGHGAAAADAERVTLRDGSVVAIRPVQPADASLVKEGFDHLSAVERYRRFITGRHLTEAQAGRLASSNADHLALGAIAPATGEGVGLARYVRDGSDRTRAVVAVVVVDDWQGRGLATNLLRRLAARAREDGIEHFEAHMIVGDTSSQRMFESVGRVETVQRVAGVLDVTVRLG